MEKGIRLIAQYYEIGTGLPYQGAQYNEDAARVRSALSKRLAKYKLRLNEDKTTCVSFSRSGYKQGKAQGVFNFLGFTFYWGRSRKGAAIPKVKTCGKTMRAKLKNVGEWARKVGNKYRLIQIWEAFCTRSEVYFLMHLFVSNKMRKF